MNHWIARMSGPVDVDIEVIEESALAMAQSVVQNAINTANLSKSDLARRMRCNRSVVSRMLSGSHNLTIKTMARAMAACGSEIRFEAVPIEWNWGLTPQLLEEGLTGHAVSTMFTPREARCGCCDGRVMILKQTGETFDSSYC